MRRATRRVFLLLAGAMLAAPLAVAQPRLPRIGYLVLNPLTDPPSRDRQAFLDGLRERGWVDGRNVELIYKSAEGVPEFLNALATELLAQRPDVIAVSGEAAMQAAKRATTTVPIVMLALGDPVGIGVVSSLARPGGNITGVSFISSDLSSKRLQLALECVPGVKRFAVVWNQQNTNSRAEADAVLAAARQVGLSAESRGVSSDAELVRALERLAADKPHLVYFTFDSGITAGNRTAIAEFGLRYRIPVISGWHFLTEAGALMSYAPDIPAMFHRAAYYVDRILKGAKPGDLPIELPTKVDLVLNQRTAIAIGVRFPRDMVLRAERVIA